MSARDDLDEGANDSVASTVQVAPDQTVIAAPAFGQVGPDEADLAGPWPRRAGDRIRAIRRPAVKAVKLRKCCGDVVLGGSEYEIDTPPPRCRRRWLRSMRCSRPGAASESAAIPLDVSVSGVGNRMHARTRGSDCGTSTGSSSNVVVLCGANIDPTSLYAALHELLGLEQSASACIGADNRRRALRSSS